MLLRYAWAMDSASRRGRTPSGPVFEVYGNRLSGNYNGITGTQQDRPDSTPPAHLLDSLRVRDNLICATNGEHPTGVVADNGDNLLLRGSSS